MSKNAGGYMGIQIGKLGPAVGSMWKGKNVYRSHNPFVKNPRTPEQQAQRAKFGVLSRLARVFSPASNFGFAYKANSEHIAQRSVFMKVNKDVLTLDASVIQIDWDLIACADGPVTAATFGTPTFADGKITIPVASSMEGIGLALDSDKVCVLAVINGGIGSLFAEVDRTGATQLEINVPAAYLTDENPVAELYGFTRTTVSEETFVEGYNGFMYPNMASVSTHIATLNLH
jgi:hypothetical protein